MKSGSLPILLLLAAISPGPSWSEPPGRLFFTPERRQAMDEQRQLNLRDGNTATLTVNGRVTRSNGHRTTWFNDRLRHENDPAPGILEKLRVGETLDVASGERRDLLPGGNRPIRKSSSP